MSTIKNNIINALSIDLEDWFCVYNLSKVIKKEDWHKYELRVVDNTNRILELLAKHNTHATFFVLGWIAERVPDLIHEIEKQGHEIASHGYSHTLLTEMTPESFEKDIQKALDVTKNCISSEIIGFRAPSFSITQKTMWAIDILKNHGFRYDSSIFPISLHPDYGVPHGSLSIYPLNSSLIEFPLSCVEIMGMRIPCSGGGYFRLFPYSLTRLLIRQCNRENRPAIFYLHSWEVDPQQPRIKLNWLKYFRHYYNLDKSIERLNRLLSEFEFTTVRKVLGL